MSVKVGGDPNSFEAMKAKSDTERNSSLSQGFADAHEGMSQIAQGGGLKGLLMDVIKGIFGGGPKGG